MLLNLKTYAKQLIEIEIHQEDTMKRIKQLVYQESGIPCSRQRLFWRGHGIYNMKMRAKHIGLTEGSILHLVVFFKTNSI